MGLLMYGYKEAEEAKKKKEAVKKDPTAAGRSAIRRQPTIRRRDNPVTDRRNGRAVRLSLSNYVVDDRDGEFVIAPRPRPRPQDSLSSWEGDSRPTHRAEVEEHLRMPTNNTQTGDSRSNYRRWSRHNTQAPRTATFAPPPRESFLRNEVRRDDAIDDIEREIYERATAIADVEQEELERNRAYWPHAPTRTGQRHSPGPQRSEHFAPAFRFGRPSPGPQPSWARTTDRRSRSPRHHDADDASRDSSPAVLSPNFPPLERTMARSSNTAHRASTPRHVISTSDGLGDRRRSPSPGNDAWETLVTTITQDERLPSTESSFTSTAASTSFSNRGHSQAETSATSPSLTEALNLGLLRDHDCDDADPGMQTPDSLPDVISDPRSISSSLAPDHVQGDDRSGADRSTLFLQSLEETRQNLERDIETYTQLQRLLDEHMSRGEVVPEEVWQAFVPRNVLASAAEVTPGDHRELL